MIKHFETYLENAGMAEHTVRSYVETIRLFYARYDSMNRSNLADYRAYLVGNFKPKTVNLRIHALNKYLSFIHKDTYKIKGVRDWKKPSLENVISNADYRLLKRRLKADGLDQWYFIVWFMGATGARISELLQIRADDVRAGYVDLYSKGGKIRRIHIPEKLRQEATEWIQREGLDRGCLFRNRYGDVITPRGVSMRLRDFAIRYKIDPAVVHPHAFRHLFAKNFLDKHNDISLLADLLGHESIETTRIYLRRSTSELYHVINHVVTW